MMKAQMLAESSARPKVVSPAGAIGLMQFLPDTWEWVWRQLAREEPGERDPRNPEDSIEAACIYLSWLLERYYYIPDELERLRFALAAYNAGRGNVNRMLSIAREACGHPYSWAAWVELGRPAGEWQTWRYSSRFLERVTGRHARETLDYVRKITGE